MEIKRPCKGEGEGEVAVFSAKRWYPRNREDLIQSATPCHDARVVGSYRGSNSLHMTVLTSKSKDYNTALQHFQTVLKRLKFFMLDMVPLACNKITKQNTIN